MMHLNKDIPVRRMLSIALGALGMFPARGVHGRLPQRELRIKNSFKGSVCVVRMPWVSLYDLVSKRSQKSNIEVLEVL